MSELSSLVTLRAATPADQGFLLTVFASTRSHELAALNWDPAQSKLFIEMQFRAQQQSYAGRYPAASNSIVLFREQPIGRLLVDRKTEEIELVDIALLSEHRGGGIGSLLVRGLMDEARSSGKSVRLSVYKLNPAVRLYDRLGFSPIADDGVYSEMIWSPAAT